MAEDKKKEKGSPILGKIAMQDNLAMQGTMDGIVNEDELQERVEELEDEVTEDKIKKEIKEAKKKPQ